MREKIPQRNVRQRMSGYALLCLIEDRAAALVVMDPQYRAVLDELDYGNEGARQKARAKLPQMNDGKIVRFVRQAERILKPSGHLILWVDKYTIGEGRHVRLLEQSPGLKIVDLMCWNTLRFGMGRRTRGSCEYIIIAQKLPVRAKGIWTDRSMRDCWPEQSDRSIHPHAKPTQLTERLIRTMTKRGDLVVDPCAGGYGVLTACIASGRQFLGCDLMTEDA